MNRYLLLLTLFVSVFSFSIFAQDTSSDDMFNTDEEATVVVSENEDASPEESVLKEEGLVFSGTFSGTYGLSYSYDNVWTSDFNLLKSTGSSLNSGAGLHLGFVARPTTDFSVQGEFRTAYPFTMSADFLAPGVTYSEGADPVAGSVTKRTMTVADISVFKLFSDFSWNDTAFFRFGKQPIHWGVGYFFSPSDDVFALNSIDFTNSSADREGPIALTALIPIPKTQHNLYFITSYAQDATLAEDIALGAKAEFVFGTVETALAAYYQKDASPKGFLMATTGYKDFSFFGEGSLALGSKKTYLVKRDTPLAIIPLGISLDYKTETRDSYDKLVFNGTLGTMYSNSDLKLTVMAQYLFNSDGYTDIPFGKAAAYFIPTSNLMAATILVGDPLLGISDIVGQNKYGMHYGLLSVSLNELFKTKLSASVLAYANLADLSGYVSPSLSYKLFDYCSLSAGASFTFGEENDELTNAASLLKGEKAKPSMALNLSVTLGSGSF